MKRPFSASVCLIVSLLILAIDSRAEISCKKAQLVVAESKYVQDNFIPLSNVELNQIMSVNDPFIEDTCKLAGHRAFNGVTASNFCEKFDNAFKHNGKYLEIISYFYTNENDEKPKLLIENLGDPIFCKPKVDSVPQQPVAISKTLLKSQQQPGICIATAESKNAEGVWAVISQKKMLIKAGVNDPKSYCMHMVQGMYKEPSCSAKFNYTKHYRLNYGYSANSSVEPPKEVLSQKTCVYIKPRVAVKDRSIEPVSTELLPANPSGMGEVLMDPINVPQTPAGATLDPKISTQALGQPIIPPAIMQKAR